MMSALTGLKSLASGGNIAPESPAYLAALRKAFLESEQVGNLIVLGGGVEWPQLESSSLFVRDFYKGCYRGPLACFTADKKAKYRKFIFLGTPGIGKSAFAWYLVWRAVREKRNVVYQSARLGYCIVFYSNGEVASFFGHATTPTHTRALLNDYSTVYISDGIFPAGVHAFTILVCGPARDVWSPLDDAGDCSRLHLPVFSWQEIAELQRTCFPAVPGGLQGTMERYARWGGIPRFVLANSSKHVQDALDSALATVDYRNLRSHLCGGREFLRNDDPALDVMHFKTNGEADPSLPLDAPNWYHRFVNRLASRYVASKVLDVMMERDEASDKLRTLLGKRGRFQAATTFYGDIFQQYAARQLAAGGSFRLKRLTEGRARATKEETLALPACPAIKTFHSVDELKSLSPPPASSSSSSVAGFGGQLLQCASESFSSVDFVLQGGQLASVATEEDCMLVLRSNGEHGPAGVLDVAGALGMSMDAPLSFYWVVPECDFDSWKAPQPLLMEGEPVGAGRPAGGAGSSSKKALVEVQQYVVAVPFDVTSLSIVPAAGSSGAASSGKEAAVGNKRRQPTGSLLSNPAPAKVGRR